MTVRSKSPDWSRAWPRRSQVSSHGISVRERAAVGRSATAPPLLSSRPLSPLARRLLYTRNWVGLVAGPPRHLRVNCFGCRGCCGHCVGSFPLESKRSREETVTPHYKSPITRMGSVLQKSNSFIQILVEMLSMPHMALTEKLSFVR